MRNFLLFSFYIIFPSFIANIEASTNEIILGPDSTDEPVQTGGGGDHRDNTGGECIAQDVTNDNDYAIEPPGTRFLVSAETNQYIHRFRVNARRLKLRVLEPPMNFNFVLWLELVIRDIHAYLISLGDAYDLIGVAINSDHFVQGSAGMSLRPIVNFIHDDLWELVSSVTQSNAEFRVDESFILEATYVNMPMGEGGNRKILNVDVVRQRSLVSIKNNDNLCLPRALVVGEMHAKLKTTETDLTKKMWVNIRDGRRPLQRQKAIKLLRDANVVVPMGGCGFREIEKFQEYYARREVAIVVYDKETFGSGEQPFFDGRPMLNNSNPTVINLYYDATNHHFDTILNLVGAAQSRFFCKYCNKRYHYVDQHECAFICSCCFMTPGCTRESAIVKCQDCKRDFLGERCFNNHKKVGSYKAKNKKICDLIKMCSVCHKRFHTHRGKHECGVSYCKLCRSRHSFNSLCFMRPVGPSRRVRDKKYLYVFYDLETRQEDPYKNHPSTVEHIPTLCIVQQVCSDCLQNDDMGQRCDTCGIREHIFKEKPVTEFLDLYLRQNSSFEKILCIAHNAGGFDAQFILREIVETRKDVVPRLILNGRNIVMLHCGRTKFIDSLNYFHMKLSALPKAFGLPPSAKRGISHTYLIPWNILIT